MCGAATWRPSSNICRTHEGGEEGAILEIFNALGESIGIATVPVSAIEPLRADQVPAVRSLAHTL